MTEITIPDSPSWLGDGIICKVVTNDNYIYIRFEVDHSGKTYSITRFVYNFQAEFDVSVLIDIMHKWEGLPSERLSEANLWTEWTIRIYGIHTDGNEDLLAEETRWSLSGKDTGKKGFLTQYDGKKISIEEGILLYEAVEPGEHNIKIVFDTGDVIEESIDITGHLLCVYVRLEDIPAEANHIIILDMTTIEKAEYYILDERKIIETDTLIYKNKAGVYEILGLYGRRKDEDNYEYREVMDWQGKKRKYDNARIRKVKKYNIPIDEIYMEEDARERLSEVYESEEVYMGDEVVVIENKRGVSDGDVEVMEVEMVMSGEL